MTDQFTRLHIDPSVRIADLAKAFEQIGLVITSSERGLSVMTKAQREINQMRKQR